MYKRQVLDLFGLCLRRRPLFLGLGKGFRERVKRLLLGVGVEGLIDRAVERISGGELQRVLLALALEPRPELLLLDEPAAGIDFQMQQSFYNLIGELNATMGVTVLLVSHDLNMVQTYAHDVLCLRGGAIQCQGPPNEILTPINMSLVFGAEIHMFPHRFGT